MNTGNVSRVYTCSYCVYRTYTVIYTQPVQDVRGRWRSAQNLRISLITTKRAYNDLEAEGFIETVAGKGSFVAAQDPQLLREANLRLAEDGIRRAVEVAKRGGITREELRDMVDILYESD